MRWKSVKENYLEFILPNKKSIDLDGGKIYVTLRYR